MKQLWLYIFLTISGNLYCQFSPVFRHLNVQDGLPSSTVYSMVQDKDGYMWFGTENGLVKYDGHVFKNYSSFTTTKEKAILKVKMDSAGRIWVMTLHSLGILRDGNFQEYPLQWPRPTMRPDSLYVEARNELISLSVDTSGHIWVSLVQPYYVRIDGATLKQQIYPRNYQRRVEKLNIQDVLFEDNADVHFLQRDTVKSRGRPSAVPGKVDMVVTRYRDDYLIFFQDTLFTLKDKSVLNSDILNLKNSLVTNLSYDNIRYIWLGTSKGLYLIDSETWSPTVYCLSDFFITAIVRDHSNNIWVATLNNGVYFLPNRSHLYLQQVIELQGKNIHTISKFGNKIVAASIDGKIWFNGSYSISIPYPFNGIELICPVDDKYTWIYCHDGLYYSPIEQLAKIRAFNSTNTKWVKNLYLHTDAALPQIVRFGLGSVKAIVSANSNTSIIGTSRGVWSIDSHSPTDPINIIQLYDQRVNDLALDTLNRLWLCTPKGLKIIDGGNPANVESYPYLFKQHVKKIHFYDDHVLIGTSNGEVMSGDYSGINFRQISTGLTYDFKTLNDSIILIATSDRGIIVYNTKSTHYPFKNISYASGLPTHEINCLKIQHDTIWVGTKSGLYMVHQIEKIPRATHPPIKITDLLIDGISSPLSKHQSLAPGSHNIEIAFTTIDFFAEEGALYAYRLLRNDQPSRWQPTSATSINFDELSHGSYHFEVKISSNNGKDAIQSISFEIQPTVFQQKWFPYILTLVIALLLFGAFVWIKRSTQNKERKQAAFQKRLQELELQALQSQMNPHFVFNMLGSIQHLIHNKNSDEANQKLVEFSQLFRLILNGSRDGEISIYNECILLEKYISLEQFRMDHSFSYTIHVDPSIAQESTYIPPMMIQPLVENALAHGLSSFEKNGLLHINFSQTNRGIRCEVMDNGTGTNRTPEDKIDQHKSHGIDITNERLEVYGDQYKIEPLKPFQTDKERPGTVAVITLPVLHKSEMKTA